MIRFLIACLALTLFAADASAAVFRTRTVHRTHPLLQLRAMRLRTPVAMLPAPTVTTRAATRSTTTTRVEKSVTRPVPKP